MHYFGLCLSVPCFIFFSLSQSAPQLKRTDPCDNLYEFVCSANNASTQSADKSKQKDLSTKLYEQCLNSKKTDFYSSPIMKNLQNLISIETLKLQTNANIKVDFTNLLVDLYKKFDVHPIVNVGKKRDYYDVSFNYFGVIKPKEVVDLFSGFMTKQEAHEVYINVNITQERIYEYLDEDIIFYSTTKLLGEFRDDFTSEEIDVYRFLYTVLKDGESFQNLRKTPNNVKMTMNAKAFKIFDSLLKEFGQKIILQYIHVVAVQELKERFLLEQQNNEFYTREECSKLLQPYSSLQYPQISEKEKSAFENALDEIKMSLMKFVSESNDEIKRESKAAILKKLSTVRIETFHSKVPQNMKLPTNLVRFDKKQPDFFENLQIIQIFYMSILDELISAGKMVDFDFMSTTSAEYPLHYYNQEDNVLIINPKYMHEYANQKTDIYKITVRMASTILQSLDDSAISYAENRFGCPKNNINIYAYLHNLIKIEVKVAQSIYEKYELASRTNQETDKKFTIAITSILCDRVKHNYVTPTAVNSLISQLDQFQSGFLCPTGSKMMVQKNECH